MTPRPRGEGEIVPAARLPTLRHLRPVGDATWADRPASSTLAAVEQWLRERRDGTVFEDCEGPALRDAPIMDAIAGCRRRVDELKANLVAIHNAPFPSAHCKRQARAMVDELAQRGAVSVAQLVARDGPLEFPREMLRVTVANAPAGATGFGEVINPVALVAWIHREALLARIDAEIDALCGDDKAALSPADRERRTSEVASPLLDAERQEAAAVWAAIEQSMPVSFRAGTAPLAILQCRLGAAPHANPSPGSSRLSLEVVSADRPTSRAKRR